MGKRRERMSEGKKNIIAGLIQEYDIKTAEDIQEITIQFELSCLPEALLKKNQFAGIAQLIERAKNGVAFSQTGILNVYSLLMQLLKEESSFQQMLIFFEMVHRLSLDEGMRVLSSGSFTQAGSPSGSRRVQKI